MEVLFMSCSHGTEMIILNQERNLILQRLAIELPSGPGSLVYLWSDLQAPNFSYTLPQQELPYWDSNGWTSTGFSSPSFTETHPLMSRSKPYIDLPCNQFRGVQSVAIMSIDPSLSVSLNILSKNILEPRYRWHTCEASGLGTLPLALIDASHFFPSSSGENSTRDAFAMVMSVSNTDVLSIFRLRSQTFRTSAPSSLAPASRHFYSSCLGPPCLPPLSPAISTVISNAPSTTEQPRKPLLPLGLYASACGLIPINLSLPKSASVSKPVISKEANIPTFIPLPRSTPDPTIFERAKVVPPRGVRGDFDCRSSQALVHLSGAVEDCGLISNRPDRLKLTFDMGSEQRAACYIVGLRFRLGGVTGGTLPSAIRVDACNVSKRVTAARWYDIPFSYDDMLTIAAQPTLSVTLSGAPKATTPDSDNIWDPLGFLSHLINRAEARANPTQAFPSVSCLEIYMRSKEEQDREQRGSCDKSTRCDSIDSTSPVSAPLETPSSALSVASKCSSESVYADQWDQLFSRADEIPLLSQDENNGAFLRSALALMQRAFALANLALVGLKLVLTLEVNILSRSYRM